MVDKDFGNVYEAEASGVSMIDEIYFSEATSVDEIDAVAYGIKDGKATRYTTAISQGKLMYDVLTGYFKCLCPFDNVDSWKLLIWRRNEALSKRVLSWTDGKTIPVKQIINEVNLIRQRVEDHTTNIARAIKVPEEGSLDVFLPPKEVRSGKVMGFDASGNPTTGDDCEQVKKLLASQTECESLVAQAEEHARQSKRSAGDAKRHAQDALETLTECEDSADEAEMWAKTAQGWHDKTASKGSDAVNRAEQAALNAQGHAADAKAEADRAEAAASALTESQAYVDKKLCYIACATEQVKDIREIVGDASVSASESSSSAAQSALEAAASAEECSAIAGQLTGIYKYCGTVATESALPADGNAVGDVYNVLDTGLNFAWDGSQWDSLAGESFATKEELSSEVEGLTGVLATKANDSEVVKLTGTQVISGAKAIESFLGIGAGNAGAIYMANGLSCAELDKIIARKDLTTSGTLNVGGSATIGASAGAGSLSVLPLGTTTALGALAYGLHVSATGGLQLFGTHFLQGDLWSDDSLKMVKGNVSLYSTDEASIGFDYANHVYFRTMPNDGTEATFELQAWQWDDDSHTTKSASAGVKLLKPSQASELEATSVLNMEEGDARWGNTSFVLLDKDNSEFLFKNSIGKIIGGIFNSYYDSTIGLGGMFIGFDTGFNDAECRNGIGVESDDTLCVRSNYGKILFPKKRGTLALTSDIPDVSNLVSFSSLGETVRFGVDAANEITLYLGTRMFYFPSEGGRLALTSDTILGEGAVSNYYGNVVIGVDANAGAENTSPAEGVEATVIGARAKTSGVCAIALGRDSFAFGCGAVALGADARAEANETVAIGMNATTSEDYPLVIKATGGEVKMSKAGELFVKNKQLAFADDVSAIETRVSALESSGGSGSVDLSGYLPLSGGQMTGELGLAPNVSGGLVMPNTTSIFAPNAGLYPITAQNDEVQMATTTLSVNGVDFTTKIAELEARIGALESSGGNGGSGA